MNSNRTFMSLFRAVSWPRPLRCLSSVALIACAGVVPGCFKYRWESKGPFEMSGAIRDILVDPVNGHRLYAAAENGGLWVLDDDRHPENGWRPLTDNLETLHVDDARVAPGARPLQMRGIAKSSVDPDYIVTANAAGFVYHSKDHGTTWSKVTAQNFQYIRRILIAEGMTRIPAGNYARLAKETKLWIACTLGLFRIRLVNDVLNSVEQLFPQTPAQQADVLDAVRNPSNDDLYVGVRGQGVWKRPNIPADPADAWILSANWAAPFADPLSPMIKLAITPDGSRLVAKFGRNVLVNDNQGAPADWTPTSQVGFGNDVGGSDIGYRGNYSGSLGEWAHAVAISPRDRNVIAVGQADLFISSSGGQAGPGGQPAWTAASNGHEDIQSLAFSSDGKSLFIANDGGVFQLPVPPGNASPKDLNTKLTTAQFFRVGLNGKVAVGNADHQGIWGTTDIEASPVVWKRATPSDNGFGNNSLENDFVSADPKTPGRFFVQFNSEHLLRLKFPATPTGGTQDLLPINKTTAPLRPFTLKNNAANRPVFNQLNYPVGAVAVDPRAGMNTILLAVHVVLDTSFGIQKTQNANVDPSGGPKVPCPAAPPAPPVGGCFQTPVIDTAVWTLVFGPDPTPIVSIAFSLETEKKGRVDIVKKWKAYALNQDGKTFVLGNVDDPAATFQPAGSFVAVQPDFARQIVADPRTAGRLFALSHFQIHLSTDGNAATWNPIGQATLPAGVQLNALCLHPTNSKIMYLATANAGVLVSEDGGASWGWIGLGLPNVPVMDVFTNATHLYAVTFGRGLWRTKLPKN